MTLADAVSAAEAARGGTAMSAGWEAVRPGAWAFEVELASTDRTVTTVLVDPTNGAVPAMSPRAWKATTMTAVRTMKTASKATTRTEPTPSPPKNGGGSAPPSFPSSLIGSAYRGQRIVGPFVAAIAVPYRCLRGRRRCGACDASSALTSAVTRIGRNDGFRGAFSDGNQ
jgi:hypothetical protein